MQLRNLPAVRREINSRMKPEEYKKFLSLGNLEHNSAHNYSPVSDDQKTCHLLKPAHYPLACLYINPVKKKTALTDLKYFENKSDARYIFYAILDNEYNDWPDEPKVLLSNVAKIRLWSRRWQ
jgi:hypothetical protein